MRREKKGGWSLIKIGLLAGLVGIVLVIAGFSAFYFDQQSRRSPLNIELFPGATDWGSSRVSSNYRNLFYRVPGVDPAIVADYYQQQMAAFNGSSAERCVRTPPTGENPIIAGFPNAIPYQYVCLFDRSGIGASQYTRVVIYPGVYNADPNMNAENSTVIQYEQTWQQ